MLRYILFHHQTTTSSTGQSPQSCCVISSFITKPQLNANSVLGQSGCVISSFITKPQLEIICVIPLRSCVISSFITKPQQGSAPFSGVGVALYPLSSPNHNLDGLPPLSSQLRYILFHHQTTTRGCHGSFSRSCVISSFITKPQLTIDNIVANTVALYPLSSPNHNLEDDVLPLLMLRYILFHHQTTTKFATI